MRPPPRLPPLVIASIPVLIGLSYWLLADLLDLPPGWLSAEGWSALPLSQKIILNLGSWLLTFVGVAFIYSALVELNVGLPRPQTSFESIERATWLTRRVLHEYLTTYKKHSSSADGSVLIEDIPSTSSAEAEQQFLGNNQKLLEAEELYRRAIALEQQTPHVKQAYNLANAYNKLGYHYRFVRRWNDAIECLQKCITLLEHEESSTAGLAEKATATFHLGLVHMARFRQSGDREDCELARRHFEASIEIDRSLGQDYTDTTKILGTLGC